MNSLSCFSLATADHVAHLGLNCPEAMNTPAFWRDLEATGRCAKP